MNKYNLPRNKRRKERRSNCFESDDWRNYGQENGGQFSKQTEILRDSRRNNSETEILKERKTWYKTGRRKLGGIKTYGIKYWRLKKGE
jgi:hypothetical protein